MGIDPMATIRVVGYSGLILLVSFQDVHRLVCIPLRHPRSARLATISLDRRANCVLAQIAANRLPPTAGTKGCTFPMPPATCADYLGAPLPNSATSIMEQLQSSHCTVYLRWIWQENLAAPPRVVEAFVPAVALDLALDNQGR